MQVLCIQENGRDANIGATHHGRIEAFPVPGATAAAVIAQQQHPTRATDPTCIHIVCITLILVRDMNGGMLDKVFHLLKISVVPR